MPLVPLRLTTFAIDPRDGRAVAVFGDDAGRHLPVWVDDTDAAQLADAARGDLDPARSSAALLVAALDACGGAVDRVELRRLERSVLHAALVVDGARGPAELPAKASTAAAVALLVGAPLLVEELILAHAHARLQEAAARARRDRAATTGEGTDEPIAQSVAERWSQTLQHLAEKLLDAERS